MRNGNLMNLETLFADHQLHHSDLQLDYFITARSGGTPYGCYKQSLRELWKRFRGLSGMYAQRALLAEQVAHLETLKTKQERKRRRLLAAKRLQMIELAKSIEDTEREFLRFYGQAAALKPVIGELTPELRAELDRDMWIHQLRCMVALDIISQGRMRRVTAELIQSLPVDARRELLLTCFGPGKTEAERQRYISANVDWFLEYSPEIPPPLEISREEARWLLECCESSALPAPSLNSLPTDAGPRRGKSTGNGYASASLAPIDVG
jgi:hypothetical protein